MKTWHEVFFNKYYFISNMSYLCNSTVLVNWFVKMVLKIKCRVI